MEHMPCPARAKLGRGMAYIQMNGDRICEGGPASPRRGRREMNMLGKKKTRYGLSLALILGLTLLYAYHRNLYGKYLSHEASAAEVRALTEDERAKTDLRDSLQREIRGLNSDVVEMEAAIRRSKDLVREGEHIYRIELPPGDAPDPTYGDQTQPDARNSAT